MCLLTFNIEIQTAFIFSVMGMSRQLSTHSLCSTSATFTVNGLGFKNSLNKIIMCTSWFLLFVNYFPMKSHCLHIMESRRVKLADCLPLFFLHKPDTISLVPPVIMPVYRFFWHKCLPYSVNNKWLKLYAKLVGCGHAMTWFSRIHGFEQVVYLYFFAQARRNGLGSSTYNARL